MPSVEYGRDDAVDVPPGTCAPPFRLADAVADLHGALPAEEAVERLLAHSSHLIGSAAGAVSVVEADGQRYRKAAERGVICQVGRSFPLDEGATGHAVAMRRPVLLADYARLRTGHLKTRGPAGHRSVLAVPVWWRGDVVAVNVAFRPPRATFSTAEADALEALSQSVAPAIAQGMMRDPSFGGLLRARIATGGGAVTVTETGPVQPVAADLAQAAAELLAALEQVRRDSRSTGPLQVAVVHDDDGVRLLVQQQSAEATVEAWSDAVRATPVLLPVLGEVRLESVPGWGLALRARLPHDRPPAEGRELGLTPREQQVLALVRTGLTDRAIGARLGVSPRTVEKHVGALLRKTGAPSRAAAVAALEAGWR